MIGSWNDMVGEEMEADDIEGYERYDCHTRSPVSASG
jgi:hypothetical protein